MTASSDNARWGGIGIPMLGVVIVLAGLAMAIEGGWLVGVGGTWYYLLAGIGMLIGGVQLVRRRPSGVLWYALVFIGTLLWTWWESGADYWRWVPRFDVVLVLGFFVALAMAGLGFSRVLSRSLAVLLALCFVAAVALAFVPYHFTHPGAVPAAGSADMTADTGNTVADTPAAGDWVAYGRSKAADRYSPLKQINADNVARLKVAWQYRTGDIPKQRWGSENTPIKVGDTVYLCTPHNIVVALDAATGKQRWRYDPKVADAAIPYTAACRGVTYYKLPQQAAGAAMASAASTATPATAASVAAAPAAATSSAGMASTTPSACATRIIEGTLDGRVIELDAKTGRLCPDFGENGTVDITDHMGQTWPGYVAINSAPVVVRDTLVVGHQVIDGQRAFGPSGVIKGYDVVTGKLKWAWDPGHPHRSRPLTGDQTYMRGSPDVWTSFTGDDKLGLVYLPVANASGDYYSATRTPAENAYAVSMTALNVETGLPVWTFQTAYKDVWDYDQSAQPSLLQFPGKHGNVPAMIVPTKQGEIYVLDRRTGKSLFDVQMRKVPGGGVEPQQRSPVQPYSTYAHLSKPDLTPRDMWGLTPFDQMVCRIQYHTASYKGQYTPPQVSRHNIEYPGYNGGTDWGSVALDPSRGVLIANYNDMPNYNILVPRAKANAMGWRPRDQEPSDMKGHAEGAGDPQIGLPYAVNVNAGWRLKATGMLCKEPPYGWIRAIDVRTGKTLWDRPLGTARRNGPFGLASGLPINIGTPNNGGSVVTAGGLVFVAAATDDLIRAIDIRSGKTLWTAKLPAGGQATPMVYRADGREYVVIVATGHHFMETPVGDYVIAYALPKS